LLHFFEMLYTKRGNIRYVSFNELLNNPALLVSLTKAGEPPEESLRNSLQQAVQHGILLEQDTEADGDRQQIYFINAAAQHEILEKINSGTSGWQT